MAWNSNKTIYTTANGYLKYDTTDPNNPIFEILKTINGFTPAVYNDPLQNIPNLVAGTNDEINDVMEMQAIFRGNQIDNSTTVTQNISSIPFDQLPPQTSTTDKEEDILASYQPPAGKTLVPGIQLWIVGTDSKKDKTTGNPIPTGYQYDGFEWHKVSTRESGPVRVELSFDEVNDTFQKLVDVIPGMKHTVDANLLFSTPSNVTNYSHTEIDRVKIVAGSNPIVQNTSATPISTIIKLLDENGELELKDEDVTNPDGSTTTIKVPVLSESITGVIPNNFNFTIDSANLLSQTKTSLIDGTIKTGTRILTGLIKSSIFISNIVASGWFVVTERDSKDIQSFKLDFTTGVITAGTKIQTGNSSASSISNIDASGWFIVTGQSSKDIQPCKIDFTTGVITAGTRIVTGLSKFSVDISNIDPSGWFIVVGYTGKDIQSFKIDLTTGVITAGTVIQTGLINQSFSITNINPSGWFVVTGAGAKDIQSFKIDFTTGVITAGTKILTGLSRFASDISNIDPSGWFVVTGDSGKEVQSFKIDLGTGVIAAGTKIQTGLSKTGFDISNIDPSGWFVVTGADGNDIQLFKIDLTTGVITAGTKILTGLSSFSFDISNIAASGWFIVTGGNGKDIQSFSIKSEVNKLTYTLPDYIDGTLEIVHQYEDTHTQGLLIDVNNIKMEFYKPDSNILEISWTAHYYKSIFDPNTRISSTTDSPKVLNCVGYLEIDGTNIKVLDNLVKRTVISTHSLTDIITPIFDVILGHEVFEYHMDNGNIHYEVH